MLQLWLQKVPTWHQVNISSQHSTSTTTHHTPLRMKGCFINFHSHSPLSKTSAKCTTVLQPHDTHREFQCIHNNSSELKRCFATRARNALSDRISPTTSRATAIRAVANTTTDSTYSYSLDAKSDCGVSRGLQLAYRIAYCGETLPSSSCCAQEAAGRSMLTGSSFGSSKQKASFSTS